MIFIIFFSAGRVNFAAASIYCRMTDEIKNSTDKVRKDIETEEDIRLLVDSFYGRVAEDEVLFPVFSAALGEDWSHHMPIMYRFWGTLLLGNMTYQGNPFLKHVKLPIGAEHFQRWLSLFERTLDDLFSGPKADEARQRAHSIAFIFQSRLGIIKPEGLS
jgi:hemoglobin